MLTMSINSLTLWAPSPRTLARLAASGGDDATANNQQSVVVARGKLLDDHLPALALLARAAW